MSGILEEPRYAVYIVLVEDTAENADLIFQAADSAETAGEDMTYADALALLADLQYEARFPI